MHKNISTPHVFYTYFFFRGKKPTVYSYIVGLKTLLDLRTGVLVGTNPIIKLMKGGFSKKVCSQVCLDQMANPQPR